jgi:aryl-alcohol dehydrogenase-like predicted oxidoreductase
VLSTRLVAAFGLTTPLRSPTLKAVKRRFFGNTGIEISEIGLGTWQVGGRWGAPFDASNADAVLSRALDGGVNFIDTADVYSDGESEKAVGRFLKKCKGGVFVATKCGRQLSPHVAEAYTPEALRGFVESSLSRLGIERIDLMQLHCPPTTVYYRPEVFELFERLVQQGKVRYLGVSVERVEEGLKAIEFPNVRSVQIIYNMLRLRPRERFFAEAMRRGVAIVARVPLASGLLAGGYSVATSFSVGDHRHFNRDGSAFDKGETFSGVPFDVGLEAVRRLQAAFPGTPLHLLALRFVLDTPAVTTVIPGASNPEQVDSNLRAADLEPLTAEQQLVVERIYDELIRHHVHSRW